ncbi:hypothetical protein BaRGS_00023768 [Batillaria attramentaria]|uniref:Uncharacterized protein n=1 Tax=Batillaria attramentaria TaxID=370345 RepID=A0ABD0KCZ8_9CAEN
MPMGVSATRKISSRTNQCGTHSRHLNKKGDRLNRPQFLEAYPRALLCTPLRHGSPLQNFEVFLLLLPLLLSRWFENSVPGAKDGGEDIYSLTPPALFCKPLFATRIVKPPIYLLPNSDCRVSGPLNPGTEWRPAGQGTCTVVLTYRQQSRERPNKKGVRVGKTRKPEEKRDDRETAE